MRHLIAFSAALCLTALHLLQTGILLSLALRRRSVLALISIPPAEKRSPLPEAVLMAMTLYFLKLRQILGLGDTCLTRSLILCRTLRQNGIRAAVAFGTRTCGTGREWPVSGHCWVEPVQNADPARYPFTVTCPWETHVT